MFKGKLLFRDLLGALALAAWAALPCSALEVVLFPRPGKPLEQYDAWTERLAAGDIVSFSDGARFEYLGVSSAGGTTRVLKARPIEPVLGVDVVALRIPLRAQGSFWTPSDQKTLNSWVRGERVLREEGLPIPKLYRSLKNEYIAVEWVETEFRGDEFLYSPSELRARFGERTLAEAEGALVEFAVVTAGFYSIGDFKSEQLRYSVAQRRWILLDWTGRHVMNSRWQWSSDATDRTQTLFNPTFKVRELGMADLNFPAWKSQPGAERRWESIIDRLDRARHEAWRKAPKWRLCFWKLKKR